MSKPVEFKCPRCQSKAFYYGGGRAACINHGWLLYTEIPPEVYTPSNNRLHFTDFGVGMAAIRRKLSSLLKKALTKHGGK